MKLLLAYLFLFIMFSSTHLAAQNNDNVSVIKYKDGSTFIGKILEQDENEIVLELTTSDTITIKKVLIKEASKSKKQLILNRKRKHDNNKNYFALDLGSNVGSDNRTSFYSFSFGRRLSSRIMTGVGFAFSQNRIATSSIWSENDMAQIFAHARFNINQKVLRPFIETKIGWGFAINSDEWNQYNGGLFVQPSIGIELATKRRMSWTFKVGQNLQFVEGRQNFWFNDFSQDNFISYKSWLNRTTFSIGINF